MFLQSLSLDGSCLIQIQEIWKIWIKFCSFCSRQCPWWVTSRTKVGWSDPASVIPYDHNNNSSLMCLVQENNWCQALGMRNSVISSSGKKNIQKWSNFLISYNWYLTFSEYWHLFSFFFSPPHQNAIRHAVNYSYISSGWLREWKKWLFLDEKCHGNIHWVILMLDCKHYVFSFHIFKRIYSLHPH